MPWIGFLPERQMDAHMREQGLFCNREYFLWGKTPLYRNHAGTKWRFYAWGYVYTPREMLADLRDRWRPAARDEYDYACGRMRQDLEVLIAKDTAADETDPEDLRAMGFPMPDGLARESACQLHLF